MLPRSRGIQGVRRGGWKRTTSGGTGGTWPGKRRVSSEATVPREIQHEAPPTPSILPASFRPLLVSERLAASAEHETSAMRDDGHLLALIPSASDESLPTPAFVQFYPDMWV